MDRPPHSNNFTTKVPSGHEQKRDTAEVRVLVQNGSNKGKRRRNRLRQQKSTSDPAVEDRPASETHQPPDRPINSHVERKQTQFSLPKAKSKGSTFKHLPSTQSDELSQQLASGAYECMICYGQVRWNHQIWSCCTCYHIFHLKCIKQWATQPRDFMDQPDDQQQADHWCCPGCRHPFDYVPQLYKCFCSRANLNIRQAGPKNFQTPHSCGNLCKKSLATDPRSLCRHSCSLPCHPGPCPQCPTTAKRNCPCGKKSQSMRCSVVGSAPSCGCPCYKTKSCGKHRCLLTCHTGPCPPCNSPVARTCHCSKVEKTFTCEELTQMERRNAVDKALCCPKICNRTLPCGNHRCELTCHPGACGPCGLLPERVSTCPCGKGTVSDLLAPHRRRNTCMDPVPTCGRVCGRRLLCSNQDEEHFCKELCHHGDCPDCPSMTTVTCRCGRTSETVVCCEVRSMDELRCDNLCQKKKHCGKHRCSTRCCASTVHQCDLICAKPLKCGNHTCNEVCHKGLCPKCWFNSYDELRCDCGTEMILPPVPCATPPPPCTKLCSREHSCGHPVYHTCHSDPTCPPCTVRTSKMCRGNHKDCFVPCFIEDVSCGYPCRKELPCGHKCIKTCHRGPCLGEGEQCSQPCPQLRKLCTHPCAAPCHFGKSCPEDLRCIEQITLKCECGRITKDALCLCPNRDDFFSFAIHGNDIADLIGQLARGKTVNLDQVDELKSVKPSARKLECDKVCEMEERNRNIRDALDISDAIISPLVDKPVYSDFLCNMVKSAGNDCSFVLHAEESIRQIVEVTLKKSVPRACHFQPTFRKRRQALHELAEAYGCDSQSFDEEPKRSVTVYATKKSFISVSLAKFTARQPLLHPRPVSLESLSTTQKRESASKVDYFDGDF